MNFHEELVTDNRFAQFNKKQQTDLLAKHCADIEERIRTASSRYEADRVSAEVCLEFEKECHSSVVRRSMKQRVQDLLIEYWHPSTKDRAHHA